MKEQSILQTPYGVFCGIESKGFYSDGTLKEIKVGEPNVILSHAGELVPFYGDDQPRRKHKASVTFHKNGMIRAISLETQQELLTPIGEFPAELVTFYETGELKRLFPVDGRISGFWSEEDERTLNIPLCFSFDFADFTALLVGMCFYKSGQIRSVTLYPNEIIEIDAVAVGRVRTRIGFSLYESEKLESFEPAEPTPINTPIGVIYAFDAEAIGVTADSNSIRLDEQGRITELITSTDRIAVYASSAPMVLFEPITKIMPTSEDENSIVPLRVTFDYDAGTVSFKGEIEAVYQISDCAFHIKHEKSESCSPDQCAGCSLCSY